MASSSSFPRNWVYDVFPSFSGEDVRTDFLTHIHKELERKLITAFKDHEIERGQSLDPQLKQAIKDSRIAVVIFSKNYASSTWCLNELLEIVQCKKENGQTVIPVFYRLDPSHVRKQTGDFGEIFKVTCAKQPEEVKKLWREALTNVANTLGYHSASWGNQAKLIENIVDDVLGKLLLTTSNDSKDFVGIEDHIAKMSALLQLNSERAAKMVGIWGSSGIGKTTIARILFKRLSRHFQGSVFIDKHFIYESKKINSTGNPDDYNIKLHLQEKLLSKILDKEGIKVDHLGAVRDMLKHRKVLIIIDDLDHQVVLDALVGQSDWFGCGSRIIVITKDKNFLREHGIDCIYEVGLPANIQALQMFCRSAFRANSPPDDLMEISSEVALLAGNLPLGLKVLGSCLRKRDKNDWVYMLPRLRNDLDGKIENTLKVSYDELNNEKDQELFRQIACLFNNEKVNDIKLLLEDRDLMGLQNLIDKSLVNIRNNTIEMHLLLQEMGKKIVRTQSKKPGEREFLMDSKDICNVLEDNTGTEKVLGIALDMDENDELHIHESAFIQMRRLLFLKVCAKQNKVVRWHIPDGFDYLPSSLRLLSWDKYPLMCMPSKFSPENLVKLQLQESKLEKLWEGVHSLQGLKDIDLQRSKGLTEIPDLSKAINLKTLNLGDCSSLMGLLSSIQHLNKLEKLIMSGCSNLETLPPGINLESLNRLDLKGCSRLSNFPDISSNFIELILDGTAISEFPSNLRLENLHLLSMRAMKSEKLWNQAQALRLLINRVCPSLKVLYLSDIPSLEELPSSIQNLHKLIYLEVSNCINLTTLPTDINFESLGCLDLSECSRLSSFPNISTNISYLYLNRTGIEEVPWWIETFFKLKYLGMNGCNTLQRVSLHISKLKYLNEVDFSDCGALIKVSFDGSPSLEAMTTDTFHSELPVSYEASSSLPYNYIRTVRLDFYNCFNLDQKALIQKQLVFCKSMMLSGEKVPSYFTQCTTGTSYLAISLLNNRLYQPSFKVKVCAVVDCKSIPMSHDTFDILVCFWLRDKLGDSFGLVTKPLYFSNLKLGSQLVTFEFSFHINEEKARVVEANYGYSQYHGYAEIHSSQVYPEIKFPEFDIEEPPRHEVQFKIKEWGLEGPIQKPSFPFGFETCALKQIVPQEQQFQQKQCVQMYQNNAHVQGTNLGQVNLPPKQKFNNLQKDYHSPIQAQQNAPTAPQDIQTEFLLQELMESQNWNAAQGQNFQQKQFVQRFQNNAQFQGNFPPTHQFKSVKQGYQAPNQVQANAPTASQESMTDLLVQQSMESQKQNAAQGQHFQQKQFLEGFENDQVQCNNLGERNFSLKQEFNSFQQGYQTLNQVQANVPTTYQQSKTDFLLQQSMESQKQNAAQGQQFQQKQFVEGFENNAQVQENNFGQRNFPPKHQFNNFQQDYQSLNEAQAHTTTSPQESKTDLLLQQLMESQKQIIEGQKQNTKETKDLNVKVDGMYNDFNGKLESLVAHVQKLEVQVAQTIEDVKKKVESKAKTFCNAASIQEESDYDPNSKQTLKLKDVIIQPKPEEPSPSESKRAQMSKLKLKTLPKLEKNLGKFVVPCSINGVEFNDSLCDTGANVNIMSKNIAEELGFLYFQPSKPSVEYADSSSTTLHGFLPNVLLQVGNCFFPTDFHIVEMSKDKHKPLILGYGFLAIVGALVDFSDK